jgi:hypothetical protein
MKSFYDNCILFFTPEFFTNLHFRIKNSAISSSINRFLGYYASIFFASTHGFMTISNLITFFNLIIFYDTKIKNYIFISF